MQKIIEMPNKYGRIGVYQHSNGRKKIRGSYAPGDKAQRKKAIQNALTWVMYTGR